MIADKNILQRQLKSVQYNWRRLSNIGLEIGLVIVILYIWYLGRPQRSGDLDLFVANFMKTFYFDSTTSFYVGWIQYLNIGNYLVDPGLYVKVDSTYDCM